MGAATRDTRQTAAWKLRAHLTWLLLVLRTASSTYRSTTAVDQRASDLICWIGTPKPQAIGHPKPSGSARRKHGGLARQLLRGLFMAKVASSSSFSSKTPGLHLLQLLPTKFVGLRVLVPRMQGMQQDNEEEPTSTSESFCPPAVSPCAAGQP